MAQRVRRWDQTPRSESGITLTGLMTVLYTSILVSARNTGVAGCELNLRAI
jgi:hypothetical protein